MTYADLHLHTYYSDGWQSPASVVRYAATIGLQTIAITDHDNVRGSQAADEVAAELGIDLIPAVELTTHWRHNGDVGRVDVLGYYVNREEPTFKALCERTLADMAARIEETCALLTADGLPITLEDVLSVNPRFAGAGPAIHAIADQGYARSFHEAVPIFYRFWNRVRLAELPTEEAIAAIRGAGGLPVLAHPKRISVTGGLITAEDIAPLVEVGLGGIEVYHPTADDDIHAHLHGIAQALDLVPTGGSDDHGFNGFRRMGTQPITQAMVSEIRERAAPH